MKKSTKIALFSGITIAIATIAFSLYAFFKGMKEMKEWGDFLEEDYFEDENNIF